MLCKYVLTVAGTMHELPKSCIRNWDEIKRALKRDGFGGVIRTFTSKFEFVGEAYELLLNEWVEKYLFADAQIAIYEITNQHTYDIIISSKLDFGTFDNSGYTISMNTVDNSTATLIKANKGTQYEYLVDEIKAEHQLYYDRLSISNMVKWIMTGDTVEKDGKTYVENIFSGHGAQTIYTIPISIVEQEITVKDITDIYDVGKRIIAFEDFEGKYFLKNISGSDLNINIKMSFDIYAEFTGEGTPNIRIDGGPTSVLFYQPLVNGKNKISLNREFIIKSDLIISFAVMTTTQDIKLYQEIESENNEVLKVLFVGKQEPIFVDVITPAKVLNCLLESINGGKEGITGKIASNYDSRLDNCVIVAAESIRGIPDAKLYTSYTKFVDWMEAVFGFVPVIDGNIVQFVHRDSLFGTNVIKEFEVDHTDFTYSVDEKLIYSSIRVGYDKQDYDSINGRDEFRFTTEYMTGVDITDNKLELISPYRADAYGIEFLAQKRGKNTTDNESDNDVFFVGATDSILVSGVMCYKLIRSGWSISGVLNPNSMFNVMYNQRDMLLANSKYIGISADRLKFTSSDGNSDVVINNIALKDDFVITERLATCGKVGFNTYDEVIPSPVDGIITLVKDEYLYKGFLSEADGQIERFDGLKYELIVKSISKV